MADPISAAAAAFASWATAATITATSTTSLVVAQTVYAIAYAAAYVGISAAITVGLTAVAQSQVPNVEGQKVTRKQPRPVRYHAIGGPSRMSGPYMLRESKGNKLGVVIALCDGRLASIDAVYLHDDVVTVSGGFVQGMDGELYGSGDLVRLETRLGEPTETHYSFLTADFGSVWPTTSRGDGIASLAFLAQHRSRESFSRHFRNGEPIPSVVGTPVCYDWRDTGQDREDPSTWQACANPVVWLVFVEWYRHGRNWDRCIAPVLSDLTAEANYCDGTVDGETRYRCAGNYPITLEPQAVREALLATFDGWLSVDGKGCLVIKAGRYEAPTFTLPPEHIRGYSWRAFQTDEEAINELVVSYVSPDHDFTEVEAGTYTDDGDIAARGKVRSEPLQLTWVDRPTQAMRLARRKMIRLAAPRRGSVRASIYGLNGLGQRFIRVQNPELSSMADVVVEVMNVEVDFANAEVVFDVILADPTIDDDETVEATPPPTIGAPSFVPGRQQPAITPISRDVTFPTSALSDTISVSAFNAVLPDGSVKTLPAEDIAGLDPSTAYGVFYRDGDGYTAVPLADVPDYKASGGWLFIGFQTTPDGGGVFDPPADPPGGWGGSGEITMNAP
ncbi:hypothetical protein [Brevundimonas subvibrioides]|uniref:Tip attachment protein J domain-containing protein n=1 Tax=Brevundimonas subvibrioides (strain ATCC 15264 / DSM 4735 / LMG 14903 / NBRC 16000 / CB 81) TaxID=633149 RepID=D9QFZ2_BRESC|nr:hypothetical protein [Brevundimonas subvibrioides]ADL00706.1 hypothetical protein Bresu_1394 [Brevundimonas subvibrioides ATCC 15264]